MAQKQIAFEKTKQQQEELTLSDISPKWAKRLGNILQKVTGVFDTAKSLTFHIHDALQPLKVIDWRQKDNIQKQMRVVVKDILYKNKIRKDVNELAARIVELLKVHPD